MILSNLLLLFAFTVEAIAQGPCIVTVSSPRMYTYIPRGSILSVICNTPAADFVMGTQLKWSVKQPLSDNFIDVDDLAILNYTERVVEAGLLLSVDNNNVMNSTVFKCRTFSPSTGVSNDVIETTLIVFEPTTVQNISAHDINSTSILLCWNPSIPLIDNLTYTVTISSSTCRDISPCQPVNLHEPLLVYVRPADAPPCEVYNFSVTATPNTDGTTYTGDSCSAHYPVYSMMLPSLPNITILELSLNYTLESSLEDRFELKVNYKPASFCEAYPVSGYVLEVEGPTTSSKSIVSGNVISVDNLLENEVYSFHIIVSNVVGNVSSNKTIIYTTDVQKVTATVSAEAITVQCMFVNGSTARGCMVVLVGQSDNVTVNLTRDGMCAADIFNDTHLLQNTYIAGVIGYDIESDGTVGTLAIIGELSNDTLTCPSDNPTQVNKPPGSSSTVIIAGVVVAVVVGLAATAAVLIVIYTTQTARKKKHKISDVSNRKYTVHPPLNATNATDVIGTGDDEDQVMPLYDLPIKEQKAAERTAGDGADRNGNQYNSAMHTPESPQRDVNKGPTYAELMEDKDHTYHTLEPPRPPIGIVVPLPGEILPDEDAPELPPPYRPGSPTPPPPPVYQDINDLPSNGAVNKKNSDIPVS